MSVVITYHSLAIDCDSPPDLQRSRGVMVGWEARGKEGGGPLRLLTAAWFGGILITGSYQRIWALICVQGHLRGQ